MSSLKKDVRDSVRRKKEIEDAIIKLQQEQKTVEEDLAATTQDAPDEGELSAEEGIKELEALRGEIDRTSDRLLKPYEKQLDAYCGPEYYKSFLRMLSTPSFSFQDLRLFLASLQNLKHGLLLLPIVKLMINHILSAGIKRYVFDPFIPGCSINDPTSKLLSNISLSIQDGESQGDAGRWRSITFGQIPTPKDWTEPAVTMSNNIEMLISQVRDVEVAKDEIIKLALNLLVRAAQIRRRLEQECVDANFKIYMPVHGDTLRRGTFTDFKPPRTGYKTAPITCMIGVGWGVSCTQSIPHKGTQKQELVWYMHPVVYTTQSDVNYIHNAPR